MILVGAMIALLSACSSSSQATSTVTFQIFGDPQEAAAYQQLIDAFEAKNEGIDVRLVAVGSQGDHMTKLATAFSGGTPPDIFLINYRRYGHFAGKGVLEPLGPRLDASAALDVEDFYPQAIDAFRFDGALTCLPQNISTPVIYYNTDLFAAAGIAAPKTGWTWDDLLKAAKKLTRDGDGDGKAEVHGLAFEPSLNRFASFIWQAGAEIVDDVAQPKAMTLFSAEAKEALRFLTDLQHRYHVVPTLAEQESEDPETRFAAGRAAMLIDSRRAATGLRAVKELAWDVAPLPVHPTRRTPAVMLHSDAYCMAKASDAKDAGFRFVEFALGPEGARIVAKTGRTVPSLISVAESDAFLDATQPPASAQVFLDQIPAIKRFPILAAWNEIESKADPVIEEWFFGGEAPENLGIEIDFETFQLFKTPQR